MLPDTVNIGGAPLPPRCIIIREGITYWKFGVLGGSRVLTEMNPQGAATPRVVQIIAPSTIQLITAGELGYSVISVGDPGTLSNRRNLNVGNVYYVSRTCPLSAIEALNASVHRRRRRERATTQGASGGNIVVDVPTSGGA